MIYADHNATSPLRPEARDAMLAAFDIGATNPSSVHTSGRAARAVVERARAQVGGAIGSRAADLIFTGGGTESDALAVQGVVDALEGRCTLIVSAIEHDAVAKSAAHSGAIVQTAYVTPAGTLDLDDLRLRMARWDKETLGTPVLCLMLANNETGIIQPVAEAASIMREAGGLTICDAVQGLGKIPVNVGLLGVDYLSVSAHKVGGPQGVGALWHRAGAPLKAILYGGGQERSLRSGTENVAGIAGFGAAAEAAVRDLPRYAALAKHRDAMESRLKAEGGVVVTGEGSPRLAGTSNFARTGFRAETQVMALDLAGVCVSAGSACSSGKVKRSVVLMAMGASDAVAESAIRTSFGWNSEPADFDGVAEAWLEAARRTVLKEKV
ncbi:cysteine desulfurase family protein [Hyphomonas johnsonii]|uniref:Cysteine desulfurase n=1 Tax=Hyphomonas johnsonii MHS-2 TaxID=1280950 RepID=A0A059FVR9_9PROT|nr:cysteine desulfurase family protein [Hyphomonas johnsonii]KCZ94518.1 class-V pyridoxal-phosphate-dependent aminotransferase [Hyphomonas johnsonii MHS-2]